MAFGSNQDVILFCIIRNIDMDTTKFTKINWAVVPPKIKLSLHQLVKPFICGIQSLCFCDTLHVFQNSERALNFLPKLNFVSVLSAQGYCLQTPRFRVPKLI